MSPELALTTTGTVISGRVVFLAMAVVAVYVQSYTGTDGVALVTVPATQLQAFPGELGELWNAVPVG